MSMKTSAQIGQFMAPKSEVWALGGRGGGSLILENIFLWFHKSWNIYDEFVMTPVKLPCLILKTNASWSRGSGVRAGQIWPYSENISIFIHIMNSVKDYARRLANLKKNTLIVWISYLWFWKFWRNLNPLTPPLPVFVACHDF